ncbi:FecR family protein [Petrimonas mucosa]|uniref:Sigma factor regulatory protein, FecR/PupR family n=1 Tax=Petrimonas mucosa TaxID=1642646 RepID=A0A1G4G578_9BACT|nr:FecR family protein [Petrimonas mucosa]SCM56414.1 Sigma factor regulatory protein, FecR/PupR family {ECO:0000313/EMBL:BAR51454,1} [Petrimonas mucosa]
MCAKTDRLGFLRYLKDEKFIEWKLLSSDELSAYWEEYLKNNPDEAQHLALADEHFKKVRLSSYNLSPEERRARIALMEQALNKLQIKRRVLRLSYAVAVSISLLVLSVLYIKNIREEAKESVPFTNFIVGNELQSENIQLVADDQTYSFQENIDIEISDDGAVNIERAGQNWKRLIIDKKAMNRLIVPYGKRSTLSLSDGSKIWFNSGSVVEFPTLFSGDSREIRLASGEIYIEVEPYKRNSFYVRTANFHIKVYGTKFNVSAYANASPSVVLVEGSVGLLSNYGEEVNLLSNDQAIYLPDGTFNTRQVDVSHHISWKDGYLLFEETPMSEVLRQIEKNYNLSFNYEKDVSLKELTCTGTIILSENLDNVMTTIALLTSTKYIKEFKFRKLLTCRF